MRKFTEKEIAIAKNVLRVFNECEDKYSYLTAPTSYTFYDGDLCDNIDSELDTRQLAKQHWWENYNNDDLLDTLLFIEFLEQNQYIFVVDDHKQFEKELMIANLTNSDNDFDKTKVEALKNMPDNIASIFNRLIDSTYRPMEALRSLASNDFKSLEETAVDEAKKQTEKSQKAVKWAIISAIISIVTAVLSLSYEHFGSTKIKSEELNSVNSKINSIIETQKEQTEILYGMTFFIDTTSLHKIESTLQEISDNTKPKKK